MFNGRHEGADVPQIDLTDAWLRFFIRRAHSRLPCKRRLLFKRLSVFEIGSIGVMYTDLNLRQRIARYATIPELFMCRSREQHADPG